VPSRRTIFISNTIPYVNARPHLGHAFEFVQTDAYARFLRGMGHDVFDLSGSDENSLKNVLAAEAEGIATRQLVDRNVEYFTALKPLLQLSYDGFIRTSADELHRRGATRFWQALADNHDLYKKTYGGLYCVGCEQFYLDSELIEGRCPEHGTVPEFIEEENYFFRLSRYQADLVSLIESRAIEIVPETRRNEVLSFVRSGLQDISFSRSAQRARGWGIPVPDDPDQVMYVWMDALTNYITALDWADDGALYQRYWAGADERIHVVGKGVTRFHAVYWPAMLLAAGLPTPTKIVVHGYVTVAGGKLSKSTGNVVDPEALVLEQGADAVRQFLLADLSPVADGDFTVERLVRRYNTDLANGVGNLVSRVTTMLGNYRDGRVPEPPLGLDGPLRRAADAAATAYTKAFDAFDHREACQALWELVRQANAYVEEQTPWNLAKQERAGDDEARARLDGVIFELVATLRFLGARLRPILPRSSEQLLAALGAAGDGVDVDVEWGAGVAGAQVTKPAALFPRKEEIGSDGGGGEG
jgi:methionyl-tRNA synthetase